MKRVLVLVLLSVALSNEAAAQADDAAYCAELGKLAMRYTGSAGGDGRLSPELDTIEAVADCNKGNYAKGIPVLEKKLRANGFSLPKR